MTWKEVALFFQRAAAVTVEHPGWLMAKWGTERVLAARDGRNLALLVRVTADTSVDAAEAKASGAIVSEGAVVLRRDRALATLRERQLAVLVAALHGQALRLRARWQPRPA